MKSEKYIEHDGIVKSVEGTRVIVEILSKSACSGCSARSLCSSSEQKTKEIEVTTREKLEEGQKVTVIGSESMGMMAVVICYAVPVVLMVAVMAMLTKMGKEDTTVGLAGLGILIPYYIMVYMLRGRLKRQFSFGIKPAMA